MRDFADLESAVRDEGSKRYLHESITALIGGANRTALVGLWTAVMLDLISKVRRLSEAGDAGAVAIAEEIDRAIASDNVRNMQRVEFGLLANAEKLEIISARQKKELERVRDDRNLCAHPAFVAKGEVFSPSVELVRSHIATAVDCCLSLPAISGKQVIRLFEDDLASDAWPGISDVESFVRHRYHEGVRESTRRNIAKIAMKYSLEPGLAKAAAVVEPGVVAYRCRCYINALTLIDKGLFDACLISVLESRRRATALNDDCLLRSLGVFGRFKGYWEFLREDEVIALDTLLRGSNAEKLLELDVFASGVPTNERIASSCDAAFEKIAAFNLNSVDRLLSSATSGMRTLVPMAISDLSRAGSYRVAEQRLGRILKLADYLTSENIREIGVTVRANNQIYEAAGTQALLRNIYEATKTVVEAQEIWEELAVGLNNDYRTRHPEDPEGYYSYSQLLSLVC